MSVSALTEQEKKNALETSGTTEYTHVSRSFLPSIPYTQNISPKLQKALKGGTEEILAWSLGTQGWQSSERSPGCVL